MNYQNTLEMIDHDGILPVKIFHYRKTGRVPAEVVLPHWHQDLELDYMIDGATLMKIGSRAMNVESGQLLLINSGDIHSSYHSAKGEERESFAILYDLSFLRKYCPQVDKIRFVETFSEEQSRCIREILDDMIRLEEEKEEDGIDLYRLKITVSGMQIFTYLAEHCVTEFPVSCHPNGRKFENVNRAIDYLHEHYDRSVTLKETAESCGLDEAYLSRSFHELTGERFHDYLQIMRLDQAYLMLLNQPSCTITEAAFQSGFPNLKSFISTFKHYYGETPGKHFRES